MSVKLPDENSFLVENELFTNKDFDEFLITFQDKYNQMIAALNKKDFGAYFQSPVLCGQLRFDRNNVQETKDVYRVVVDMGALVDTGLTTATHGITFDTNTEIIRLYGVANQPGVDAIKIEYPMVFNIDSTNINITTIDDKSAYTVCTVVVEYIGGT